MKKNDNSKRLLSQVEYAERRGVSKQYVNKLVRAGTLKLIDGRIDPVAADKRLAASSNPAKTALKKASSGEGSHSGENLADDLLRARVKREREQGRLAELQRQKLEGELVAVAEVERAQFTRAAAERDALMNWSTRFSADIAAELGREQHLVATILDKYIRRHLAERSKSLPEGSRDA